MFFQSIPSSSTEIVSNTPLEAKSLRYIFFENKNGGMFSCGSVPDCISIAVNNTVICRNMIMLPFCTETLDRRHYIDWRKVALRVGMDVNNSQVKISGVRDNDVNIVFVYDTKTMAESDNEADRNYSGVTFMETKLLRLRSENPTIVNPAPQKLQPILAPPQQEIGVQFDKSPLGFFIFPTYSRETDGKLFSFPTTYIPSLLQSNILVDVYGADTEIFMPKMDVLPLCATNTIAWKNCVWFFSEETKRNLFLKLYYTDRFNRNAYSTIMIDGNAVNTIDLAFTFLYKKI
ncbi:MAG: hypothetical protein LBU90_10230 [Bacteroidales bacterium]|jgi:hypothetical protein|nr:hypothetical protein [Bacteroidales bacterium]